MTALSSALIQQLRNLRERVPGAAWLALASKLREATGQPTGKSVADLAASFLNADPAWNLRQLIKDQEFTTWSEVAAILEVTDAWVASSPSNLDIVWTGPANGTFPIRRIDQVLYDLIAAAKKRIFLVTFAAYRIPLLCEALNQAITRGVDVTLLLESEATSSGQLSFDASNAFKGLPLNQIRMLHWPLENRPLNNAGKPGKLHVKCAIIDDTAVISSANLTDDAFNRNMELGVVIRSTEQAANLIRHFEALRVNGSLAKIDIG